MLRGTRNHYSLFADEPTPTVHNLPADKRGRSDELITSRNELLMSRYYYYTRILHYDLPKAYAEMEKEIFLTRRTIEDIVQKNWDMVREFKNTKPEPTFFKKKFPFMVWAA